jgi:hypothetical protein
LPAV